MRPLPKILFTIALLAGCANNGGGGTKGPVSDMAQVTTPIDMNQTTQPMWAPFASRMDDSRWGVPLAYSTKDKTFIAFAGSQYPLPDTGGTFSLSMSTGLWTQVTDTKEPTASYCSCAVYLPDQNQVLQLTGLGESGPLPNAAWTLDLGTGAWSAVAPPLPKGEIGCAVTYMPNLGKAILFGGLSVAGFSNETWSYDPVARTFTQLAPATSPGARSDSLAAYDPADGGRMLVFAGTANEQADVDHYNDLWAFDGTNWSQIIPQGGPPPVRRVPAGGFDPVRRRWVIFGGTVETMDLGDLWQLDVAKNTWTQLTTNFGPDARGFASGGYDPTTDSYFVVGGLQQPNDTTETDGWKLTLP